jgi:hypothetical protein
MPATVRPFQAVKVDWNAVTSLNQTESCPRGPDAGGSKKSSFIFAWNELIQPSGMRRDGMQKARRQDMWVGPDGRAGLSSRPPSHLGRISWPQQGG